MMSVKVSDNVADYLAGLSPDQRKICEVLRKRVIQCAPGAIEMTVYSVLGYSRTPSSFDRIVYIAPQRQWVNLGFFFGSDLPDPGKVLTGSGARMRHIKIRSVPEANDTGLEKILKAAWKKSPNDIEKIHKRRK
jgi:hypothetical protein